MHNIEAKAVPYHEAHQSILQNWMSGFEFSHHMHVAVASNDKGPIVTVCYVQVDDSFLITAMGFAPKSTAAEQKDAGDAVDLFLEQQAQIAGVTKLLMVTSPSGTECKEVSIYESRITSVKSLAPPSRVAYVN
jgi:hypothetical protein